MSKILLNLNTRWTQLKLPYSKLQWMDFIDKIKSAKLKIWKDLQIVKCMVKL